MFKTSPNVRAPQVAPFPVAAYLTRPFRMPSIGSEWVIAAAGLFFTLFSNHRFWMAWAAGRDWSHSGTWLLAAAMAVLLTAVHCFLLGLVITRYSAKPMLAVLFIVTALAVHYMERYTVFYDMNMVRNVLHTNTKEARELLSFSMLGSVLMSGVLPALIVARLTLTRKPLRRAVLVRLGFLAGTLLVIVACIAVVFQDLSALMRNQKEMRHLITPSNFIVSTFRVATAEGAQARKPRLPIGTDARLATGWIGRDKPLLLVLVVGETARSANWGLNGYVRQTTPRLAAGNVINFPHVTSCGTNTEVSVPCMFSMFGRKGYDEKKIRGHESLLHVLEHGGVKTVWRDNQSGCKGVCEGLEQRQMDSARDPALCEGEHCLDGILLQNMDAELEKNRRPLVVVLHQLGNHGPAYSRRYPASLRRFAPTCDTADLGKCTREEIVNSYDNALLYTDQLLAETIRILETQTTHHAAMIYVSDHGESLGENGIYLHGMPYAIAPREQTEVPMVMWLSPDFSKSTGLDQDCLRRRAVQTASHDNLFHSVLGMMQVTTSVYDRQFDIAAACRA